MLSIRFAVSLSTLRATLLLGSSLRIRLATSNAFLSEITALELREAIAFVVNF